MKAYIIKRVFLLLFLVAAVSTIVFFLLHVVPGDPVYTALGPGAAGEDILRLHRELNLDKPLISQYLDFLKNLGDLSFGKAISNGRNVMDNILPVLPYTVYLAVTAMLLGLAVSLPLGVWAAFKENSGIDLSITFFSSAALALPAFFLGPLLIMLFSIKLGWLPVSGSDSVKHLILPALTLGTGVSAYLTRIVKSAVGMELEKPYILLAIAKGLSPRQIFFRHLFKNALIPIVTTGGLQLGALLSGAIITETVFSWHGIGSLLVEAIKQRDYPMVQGIVLFITFAYLTLNFLVDMSYFFIDPRIRHELKKR